MDVIFSQIIDHYWEPNDPRLLSLFFEKLFMPSSDSQKKANSDDSSDDESSTNDSSKSEPRNITTTQTNTGSSLTANLGAGTTTEEDVTLHTPSSGQCYGVASFFISPQGTILPQENFYTNKNFIGILIPDFIFVNQATKIPKIIRKKLRDFVGISNTDNKTNANLMNFSYFLTVGDLDQAYRSVRTIKSNTVWESMAKMCVKTRRLDVADICMANLSSESRSSFRIADANLLDDYFNLSAMATDDTMEVKSTTSANSDNVVDDSAPKSTTDHDKLRLAVIALDLGMYSDSEQLFTECKRFDLVVKMYQALGRWSSSIEMCENHDRIHLKAARFRHAEYLQSAHRIAEAISSFEKSGNHIQIAAMLLSNKSDLAKYIKSSTSKTLHKWYAQYAESMGSVNSALEYYEKSQELVSLVRLCCDTDDIESAEKVIEMYSDYPSALGAAFQLANYFEEINEPKNAIKYYQQAQSYDHALRLCMENNFDETLVDITLKIPSDSIIFKRSNPIEMVAKYFEENGDASKAVTLYEKSNNINKAMDLCIQANLFNQLKNIAVRLLETRNDDPNNATSKDNNKKKLDSSVASRFADYFISFKQYDNAVSMLVIAHEYEKALSLCINYDVRITNDLAEKLTPPKFEDMSETDSEYRVQILLMLAKCLRQQQAYQLACKKYTQAGDKLKAIKCLIKAGDTAKVIYYASKSKNADISILTANYLQSLDWHSNPQYTKSIIQFYNNAKAYLQLCYFYDACAMIEIDDYRDYDKALRALKQAYKQLKRCKNQSNDSEIPQKLKMFDRRVKFVQQFVDSRKLAQSDPTKMIEACEELIKEPEIETAVRVGDVYALMVEYYYSKNEFNQAYDLIKRMKEDGIELGPYLDKSIMQQISREMGINEKELLSEEDQVSEEDIVDDNVSQENV